MTERGRRVGWSPERPGVPAPSAGEPVLHHGSTDGGTYRDKAFAEGVAD